MPDPFVKSLLAEVARHLAALVRDGTVAAIDLRSLPLSIDDRARLEAALGQGEVKVTIDAAGESELHETAYAGVWWVRHFGAGRQLLTERIEITPLPEVLAAAPEDIAAGARRLAMNVKALVEGEKAHA